MKARLLIDMSDKLRKGAAPPKGQEARYVRAGLAEEVKPKRSSVGETKDSEAHPVEADGE